MTPIRKITALMVTVSLAGLGSGPAVAQSITVDSLDAPKAFTPGIEVDGALEAESWQGTSADRAIRLIERMPLETTHPIVRDMMRRVILSGLVPPQGAEDAYESARISAAQELASPSEYERFANRNPAARAPKLRADAFIAKGDLASACEISDALQQGRGESYWIRLRAACHELRDETSLGDLARDILRDRGEPIELVVPDPTDDFWVRAMDLDGTALTEMMREIAGEPDYIAEPETGLTPEGEETLGSQAMEHAADMAGAEMPGPETSEPELQGASPTPLFPPSSDLAGSSPTNIYLEPDPAPQPVPTYDLDAALDDPSAEGTARLFLLGRDGDARAVAAFVDRAAAAGIDPNTVLPRIPAVLDPTDMAGADLPLFARYAAMTRDIALMQALYIATEDEAARERLALASDALGGGYYDRPLGDGLETALNNDADGSETDVLIALALGADLEEGVEQRLSDALSGSTPVVTSIALDQAIERGARAETLLRLANLLDARPSDDGVTLYRVLRDLRRAGLSETAGQLAAYEYLRGL